MVNVLEKDEEHSGPLHTCHTYATALNKIEPDGTDPLSWHY